MRGMMKIYLVGKVSKNGWRDKIVGHRCGCNAGELDDPTKWPLLSKVVFGEHDYVGPFMISCDHGCYHGDGQHGLTNPEASCCFKGEFSRKAIVQCCLNAVKVADLVFCWLDAEEDYGSMIEIGYALALGKDVVVSSHNVSLCESHWFACEASCLIESIGPEDGLRRAIEMIAERRKQNPFDLNRLRITPSTVMPYTLPRDAWTACESPIEKAFLAGVVTVASRRALGLSLRIADKTTSLTQGQSSFTVHPQYRCCGHRADFMVEHRGVRAIVECDGHDYHERDKQQAKVDRQVDRARQREGFVLFRFTGSEIYNNPEHCAEEMIGDLLSRGDQ